MTKGHKTDCKCFVCLAKKGKQIHTKERNLKISKAHKGKPKPWLHKKPKKYVIVCKICGKKFVKLKPGRTICDKIKCQKQRGKNRIINSKTEQGRRKKISKALKGKMPKNLITNINAQNSPPQKKLYKLIKKIFPNAEYNLYVKTPTTRRFIDIGIKEHKVGFEYNGKIHLLKSVKENDRKRNKELKEMGWKLYIVDRNTVKYITLKSLQALKNKIENKAIKKNGDL